MEIRNPEPINEGDCLGTKELEGGEDAGTEVGVLSGSDEVVGKEFGGLGREGVAGCRDG